MSNISPIRPAYTQAARALAVRSPLYTVDSPHGVTLIIVGTETTLYVLASDSLPGLSKFTFIHLTSLNVMFWQNLSHSA